MWDIVSITAKLRASTVTINDDEILLYKRARSFAWQAKFKIGSRWVRTTTKLDDLDKAKRAAKDLFTEYMSKNQVPSLLNKGRDAGRRPDFTQDEYRRLIANFPAWIERGRKGKFTEMRLLLRDYVLILANTGMRASTEMENLLWQHVRVFREKGNEYLEMTVNGKTGRRDIICRANTVNYLKRIHERCLDIRGMTFEQLLKSNCDKQVFRLSDGTASMNLRQTFKAYVTEIGLLKCPRTGIDRTLYSLRHTYATLALIKDGMEIHTLAKQMGTSITMIEQHYSHLTPRLKKDMLTGKRCQLAGGVNAQQDDDGD